MDRCMGVGTECKDLSITCCCCWVTVMSDLWDPMDYSMPGFSVLYHLPVFAQTYVHWISDAYWLILSYMLIPTRTSTTEETLVDSRPIDVSWGLSSCRSQALKSCLSSCGTWAYLLQGMWNLLRTGIEPMSPALAVDSCRLYHQGSPARAFSSRLHQQWDDPYTCNGFT